MIHRCSQHLPNELYTQFEMFLKFDVTRQRRRRRSRSRNGTRSKWANFLLASTFPVIACSKCTLNDVHFVISSTSFTSALAVVFVLYVLEIQIKGLIEALHYYTIFGFGQANGRKIHTDSISKIEVVEARNRIF